MQDVHTFFDFELCKNKTKKTLKNLKKSIC